MKIQSAMVQMQSKHHLEESNQIEEKLTVWVDGKQKNEEVKKAGVILDISEEAKTKALEKKEKIEFELSEKDKERIDLLQGFLKALTGKTFKFTTIGEIKIEDKENFVDKLLLVQKSEVPKKGWGFAYDYHESTYESEQFHFQTDAIIRTEDGRTITVGLEMKMKREFASQFDFQIQSGDALIDPLVINLEEQAPTLTQEKYTFDIDNDGTEDQISFIGQGSGFLAIDKNEDGIINNGSELFGPKSGNGFKELSEYDEDGNNWIDENDDIYSKLRIWTKDEQGNDQLLALGEKGIGAIYLGNVKTPFDIKNQGNENLGKLQSSGMYLKENGIAGTIHHIDLAL